MPVDYGPTILIANLLQDPMFRAVFAILLISNVVICPFRCLGQLTISACAKKSTSKSCACCHKISEPNRPVPKSPAKNDGLCFCNGAFVMCCKMDCLNNAGDELIVALPVPSRDFNAEICAISTLPVSLFPPNSTGRDIRTLTCALLI